MWVRATKLGYYGHKRRREGAVFQLEPITRMRKDTKTELLKEVTIKPEQQFSAKWMERVTEETPKKETPGLPPKTSTYREHQATNKGPLVSEA